MSSSTPPGDAVSEILAVFDRRDDPYEPLSTGEVAGALDSPRETVRERMKELAERGDLATKEAGTGRVWWRPLPSGSAPPSSGPDLNEYPSLVNDVLDSVTVGVIILDSDFDVAWINETAKRYLGTGGMDVIGRDKRTLVRETIADAMADSDTFVETVLSTYEDNTCAEEFEVRTSFGDDRTDRWLEHRSKPIESGRYAGGRVEFYYDVTERKRVHEEHQLQLSVSQSIAEAASLEDGLRAALRDVCEWTDWEVGQAWVPSGEGYVVRSPASYVESEAFAGFEASSREFTFAPGEGIPGRVLDLEDTVWFHDVTVVPEEVYPRTELAADSGLRAGLGVPVVADGELAVVLEFYLSEQRGVDERLVETVASVATELGSLVARKQTEKALDQQYALLEQVMEAAPVGISVFDADGGLERANSRTLALRGLSESDVGEFHAADHAFYDENGDPVPFEDQPFATVMETGAPVYDWVVQSESPGESRQWLSINAAPIANDEGEIERVVTVEEDVTELQEQYRAITEAANDVVVTIDEDSTIRSVNPAIREMFGYGQTELIGEPLTTLIPDELIDRHRDAFDRYLETGERTLDWDYIELPGVRADGTEISLAVSFSEIEQEGDRFFTGIIRDITERKEYQRKLEESNERLEQFAYAVSHDLQEPLRMVSSYLQLVEERYADGLDDDAREFIEFAVDGADRMREMIDGLLEYSRIETRGDPLEPVDLDDVVSGVLDDLQVRIEERDADLETETLPRVEGDASQLRQVVQNLVSNALAYSGDEPPRIRISAERTADEWVIAVSDAGIGIGPDDQDRIFEVFERLHAREEHEGTGIGLALCRHIVERHGGEIWVDSTPGEGATFSFTLPAADDGGRDAGDGAP